jgi:DNA-binding transcriptional LysR family regulator
MPKVAHDIGAVEKTKIIMREEGSGTREVLEELFKEYQVGYQIDFELGNTEAIKKAVEAGLGVSCISRRCTKREADEGRIAVVPLKRIRIMREFHLIYHKDKFMSKLFNLFINFSQQEVT